MKFNFFRTAYLGLLLTFSGFTQAGIILDQSFEPGPNEIGARIGEVGSSFTASVFQSFTVGTTGTLDSLEIYVNDKGSPNEALSVNIIHGNDPSGSVLATTTISHFDISSTPSFVSVDFSMVNLAVNSGEVFSFMLSSKQDFIGNVNEYVTFGKINGGYAGGEGALVINGNFSPSPWDFYFRTNIDVAEAPEPSTLAIFALAMIGFGTRRLMK